MSQIHLPAGSLKGKDLRRLSVCQLEKMSKGGTCIKVKARVPKEGRSYHTESVPNGLEAEYAAYLETRLLAGEIVFWEFEKIRLTLADRTTLLPDFFVVLKDGSTEFHDTKGFWRDDARVKFKVAAHQFPCFSFLAVKKGSDGQWEFEDFVS